MVRFSVGSDECIVLLGTKYLLICIPVKDPFTIIDLPHTVIETDTIRASIAKQIRISGAVFRIMHVSVTVHLKPVDVGLLWQTNHTLLGRKDDHLLLQLVETELYVIIDHTIITDAAIIHVRIVLIIGIVMPQPCLVLWFNNSHI